MRYLRSLLSASTLVKLRRLGWVAPPSRNLLSEEHRACIAEDRVSVAGYRGVRQSSFRIPSASHCRMSV
jgi:hypothetical protein